MRLAILSGCLLLALLAASGCQTGEEDRAKPEGQGPPREGALRVSREAQEAAGIRVVKIALESVRDHVTATGWLGPVPGKEVALRAPAAGFLSPDSNQGQLQLGQTVTAGQSLGSLNGLFSPQDQAQLIAARQETEALVKQSQAAVQSLQGQIDHLKSAQGAVAGSKLRELQLELDRARIAYEEAQKKLPFLPTPAPDGSLRVKSVPITSPLAGRIISAHAVPRQFVSSGDALWTIADWSRLWVRVPVFEGDLARIHRDDPADVTTLEPPTVLQAKPVRIPQPIAEGRRTMDLFYEIENPAGQLRPGQAVTVSIPVGSQAQRIVVSRSAVLWDGMGGAWAYVCTGPETFVRRRLELGPPLGDRVVVQRGLQAGDQVVTLGAEALRGEEFKSEIPSGDED